MKKTALICLLLLLSMLLTACGGGKDDQYVLNEDTFFLVMTNMQYYPEQYLDAEIEYDGFIYELQDVDGNTYTCGVRKCSSGYGCTCGRDTIIGFLLEADQELPAARNQSEDSNDKAWVHLSGRLQSAEKTTVTIHSYREDGTIDPDNNEQIVFLVFDVSSCEPIEDYSNLNYYVTK